MRRQKVYIVMGVSGVGKTTIGRLLAKQLEIPFFDADDFHPLSNVEKMKAGIPLNDDDRREWLEKSWNKNSGMAKSGRRVLC